jgi:hypothetical protein
MVISVYFVPWWGAMVMSLSAIIVALNVQLLRRLKLGH